MDVDMETELARFGEDFITDDTNATSIICHAATDDEQWINIYNKPNIQREGKNKTEK
jgi:hypothetical protein